MNISCKSRFSTCWARFVAVSVFAVALAGCGGGSSSSAPAAGAAAPAAGAPVGAAVITAAAAAPTTTNTAANPAQAFALIATVGAAPVTIQSPPVVNFTVIDAAGKFVPGLKLIVAAGKADPACTTSTTSTAGHVTFAMAKLDSTTGHWQSLISRQRLDASVTTPITRYSVVEGTTDPKPTTTLTNPDTAVSDPSTRVVGILEENTSGGYYTYRFATDVVTPLLLKDAVAGRSFASSAATSTAPAYQNRIANNGNVAVKDGKTIHRVGVQLCYTDPVSKAKVVVNPTMDFTLGADGVAVPVKAADGKTIAPYRKVVDAASCNECHSTLTAHGTRVDPNYCVICHNPGSGDYYNNTSVDFRAMVHKIHAGAELNSWFKTIYKVASVDFSKVNFPQPLGNCTKCHDGAKKDAAGAQLATQGDNWKSAPTRVACGSCHAGIDFAKNTGVTIGDAAKGLTTSSTAHIGGAKTDDTQCVLCHTSADIPAYHSKTIPTTQDASKRTMSATITNAAVAVDGSVTVTFKVTDGGAAVTDSTKFTKPSFGLVKLVPAALGSSTYWVSYTARFRTKDAAKAPVLQSSNENTGTLTANADGTFSYKFELKNGSTPGNISTISHAHVASSVGPAADTTIGTWTWNAAAKTWTEASTTGGANTGPNTVAYEPTLTHRVAMTFQKVGTTNVDNLTNAYFDFVPDGSAVKTTRNIVTMNTCATCHAGVKLHSGYATEYCVTCHNQLTLDPFTADPVDFQRIVHKLHRGKHLPSVVAGGSYVINGTHNYSYSAFPGNIADCEVCHSQTATKPGTTTLLENRTAWYTTPTQRACGTCHDSTVALGHIASNVTASGEQCTFCHSDTSAFGLGVRAVHKK